MATPTIIRRFRKELRKLHNIQPDTVVKLKEDAQRSANIDAACKLLKEAFNGRISIRIGDTGFICGSRDEAALYRLQEYTRADTQPPEMLLADIPAADLNEYLQQNNIHEKIFVPDSPEKHFFDKLVDDFPSVRYGL